MAQYIDKSALVAEINRRIKEHHSGYLVCLKDILSFLNTLEVKDIEDMLEDAKDETMRDIAWKVHVMISDGKSIAEIDHYVCGICDF